MAWSAVLSPSLAEVAFLTTAPLLSLGRVQTVDTGSASLDAFLILPAGVKERFPVLKGFVD